MLTIGLEGVECYASHGYYREEGQLHTRFIVDVEVDLHAHVAAHDQLHRTLNYELIHEACTAAMDPPARLLETVARRIADRIWATDRQAIASLEVRLRKCAPPLAGTVSSAYVRLRETAPPEARP